MSEPYTLRVDVTLFWFYFRKKNYSNYSPKFKISLSNAPKKKYMGVSLIKHVSGLYAENYIMLMKEIKKRSK